MGAVTPSMTDLQRKIVETIRQWSDEYGYSPSVKEIGATVGLSSMSSVHRQLQLMEYKGVSRTPGICRLYQVHRT